MDECKRESRRKRRNYLGLWDARTGIGVSIWEGFLEKKLFKGRRKMPAGVTPNGDREACFRGGHHIVQRPGNEKEQVSRKKKKQRKKEKVKCSLREGK